MTALDGEELTALVRAIEGVADAFPPPTLSRLVTTATGDPGARPDLAPSADGRHIDARIATRRSARSADTARTVADVLAGQLDDPEAQIFVQIARIS